MMKKNRPGVLLTAVCDLTMEGTLADIILEETSTLGVRTSRMKRFCLQREFRRVETPYGPVKVKIGLRDGRVLTVSPEYAECRRLAEEHGVPLKDVYRAAIFGRENRLAAILHRFSGGETFNESYLR
jgi:uncharacterized protein (DUF111 family)